MEKIKILELFGGVGSPRCALRNIGVPVKAIDYVEIDEKAVRSYNSMFEKDLKYKTQDVRGYNLKPDILIHGSPCQSFSIAGKQQGADEESGTESSLMWETVNIIKQMGEWKPRIVIWENVKNVLSKHMVHNFNKYLSEMEDLGYTNSFELLDARDFGLPQARKRVFTISILGKKRFNFDDLIHSPMKNINIYLEDNNVVSDRYIVTQPSILSHIGEKGVKRATVINDFAYTITTRQDRSPCQVVDMGNGKYRFLTERECWRLQGYTDEDYENALKANPTKKGCMNFALYKQAGNSIAVPIFESIFRKILFNEIEVSNNQQTTIFDFLGNEQKGETAQC